MIKEGYDHFEVSHLEPRVGVCEKRYIFETESTDNSPTDRCPAYRVPRIAATIRSPAAPPSLLSTAMAALCALTQPAAIPTIYKMED
jgi:murein L,D-transpeptidase YafK